MRRLLNAIYASTAALAALSMCGLLCMVLLSILSRQFHVHVPGTDAYAGYLMAGAGFLALAHTLKRVNTSASPWCWACSRAHTSRHGNFSLVLASLLAWLFAFYSCRLVWQSIEFHDISTGNDATPLWIPQLVMALGTVIFALAFVDELILEIRGQRQAPDSNESLRNE